MKSRNIINKGITLLEIIITMTILSIVFSVIMSLNKQYNTQLEAKRYYSETLFYTNLFKAYINDNFANFKLNTNSVVGVNDLSRLNYLPAYFSISNYNETPCVLLNKKSSNDITAVMYYIETKSKLIPRSLSRQALELFGSDAGFYVNKSASNEDALPAKIYGYHNAWSITTNSPWYPSSGVLNQCAQGSIKENSLVVNLSNINIASKNPSSKTANINESCNNLGEIRYDNSQSGKALGEPIYMCQQDPDNTKIYKFYPISNMVTIRNNDNLDDGYKDTNVAVFQNISTSKVNSILYNNCKYPNFSGFETYFDPDAEIYQNDIDLAFSTFSCQTSRAFMK